MGDFEQKDIARCRRSANRPSLDIEESLVFVLQARKKRAGPSLPPHPQPRPRIRDGAEGLSTILVKSCNAQCRRPVAGAAVMRPKVARSGPLRDVGALNDC